MCRPPVPCFTEAMYFLGDLKGWNGQDALWRFIERGALRMHLPTDSETRRMRVPMEKYRDTPMDLADASLLSGMIEGQPSCAAPVTQSGIPSQSAPRPPSPPRPAHPPSAARDAASPPVRSTGPPAPPRTLPRAHRRNCACTR